MLGSGSNNLGVVLAGLYLGEVAPLLYVTWDLLGYMVDFPATVLTLCLNIMLQICSSMFYFMTYY